jgi:TRAP-type C4-dicarboxylate transport system permease small subunit
MTTVKNGVDKVLTWVCVVLFSALVLVVMWQVVSRQILDSPSAWSEELAKYLFIWLGLFGAALVFGERGHVAVDLLVQRSPRTVQLVLMVLVQIAILAFAVLGLVWGGVRVSALAWDQNLTGLPFNVGWLYTALPISGALTVLYTAYHLVRIVTGAEAPVDPDAERDLT